MRGTIFFQFSVKRSARLARAISLAVLLALSAAWITPARGIAQTLQPPEPALVTDIRPKERSANPVDLTAVGDAIFFQATDGETGVELWMIAPPYSSARLVADICPGSCSSSPSALAAHGTRLFFSASQPGSGDELWVSEPPYNAASTFRVADIHPGDGNSAPREITPIGDAVFFTANDGDHGRELWRASPPFTQAVMVKDILAGPASSELQDLVSIGWMLFFSADDGSGMEIWRADPPYSAASTARVADLNPDGSANPEELTRMGLKLFFSATDGESGQELWLLESPYQQPRRVTDITGSALSTAPFDLYPLGDILFFTGNINFTGMELFKSRPDYESTTTTLVRDIRGGFNSSFPQEKYAIGSTLFFTAYDGAHGFELWKSLPDYLPESTELVLDIYPGPTSSAPQNFTSVGTTLYFTAGDAEYGYELWRSAPPYDDTSTSIVADIYAGGTSSDPADLIVVQNALFFAASDETWGREIFQLGGYYGIPNTGFAPNRVTALQPQPAEKAYRDVGGLGLQVPTAGVQAEIVGVPTSVDGWDLDWLSNQAGYLSGTAFPTRPGNTVLTGHVYLPDGSAGPFANLNRVRYGDRLTLTAWGQRYIYEVRSVQTISPQDSAAVFQHEELDWLTLVTCQGYDAATDSYRARLMVRAVLVDIRQ